MILVRWCIPDMSSSLRDQIRRETYITNEIIIRQETARARLMCQSGSPDGGSDGPQEHLSEDMEGEHWIRALHHTPLTGAELDLVMMVRTEEEQERRARGEEEERRKQEEADKRIQAENDEDHPTHF